MNTRIVRIGNSQGVRIPKALLSQTRLKLNGQITFEVHEDSIVIRAAAKELSGQELALVSEKSLAKLWNDPREDEAWKDL